MEDIEINVDENYNNIYFIIKYHLIEIKIDTTTEVFESLREKYYVKQTNCCDETSLDQFITDLSNNKDCYYDESYWYDCEKRKALRIEIENDTIIMSDNNITIKLPDYSKHSIINAMKKYQNMINNYILDGEVLCRYAKLGNCLIDMKEDYL